MCIRRGDLRSPAGEHSSPLLCSENILMSKRRRHRAKPLHLKMHKNKGSPFGRAPAIAGEREIVAFIRPLRRLRRHLSQRERLFDSLIITQIGRENKFSAEIFVPAISPLRMQRERGAYFFVWYIINTYRPFRRPYRLRELRELLP